MALKLISARGNAENVETLLKKAERFAKKHDVELQFFDADKLYGKEQLEIAYEHACRAFERGNPLTKDRASELLLYASCQHQIKVALKRVGITEKTQNFVIALLGEHTGKIVSELLTEINLKQNDAFGAGDDALTYYGIAQKEIDQVPKERRCDLILERMALVDMIT